MRRTIVAVCVLLSTPLIAADPFTSELKRYVRDAKDLSVAPLHWDRNEWIRFSEGAAAVAFLYATDRQTYDAVQRNRSSFSNRFAKNITPFGGHRSEEISVLLIAAGALGHDANTRDAGRDALEAEVWAGGVVTPLLKRVFGRARPNADQGAHSFRPFSKHESFPSGHATSAFAVATAIAGHYDNWVVPTICYTIASGVAMSRVNDRAHFVSDVLAGALIGRAVGKSIVWRHRRIRVTVNPFPVAWR